MGKVDKLPPPIKNTVEQMLLSGSTYKEIVEFLAIEGEPMSQMAISKYARKFQATVEMMQVANNNFKILAEQIDKMPNVDMGEALLRISSLHVMNALSGLKEEDFKEVNPIDLINKSSGLVRATAYKKRIDVQNQEVFDNGVDAVKGMLFEMIAKEDPTLYKKLSDFLETKKVGDS